MGGRHGYKPHSVVHTIVAVIASNYITGTVETEPVTPVAGLKRRLVQLRKSGYEQRRALQRRDSGHVFGPLAFL